MTWLGQVRHVMAKDLRHARWPLGAYAAIIAVTARNANMPEYAGPLLGMAGFAALLLGVVLAASFVQADSPTRSTAFWASRPFHPSAVMVAKLLTAGLFIVAVAAAGEAFGLHTYDLPARDIATITSSAVIEYGLWMIGAMVVAGLTEDLRSFVVAAVVVMALIAIGGLTSLVIIGVRMVSAQPSVPLVFALLIMGAAVAFLAYLYQKRDTRRRVWAVGVVILALVFITIQMPDRAAADDASFARVPLHMDRLASNVTLDRNLQLRITADSAIPSERQLMLVADSIYVHLQDGTTFTLSSFGPAATVHAAALPAHEGITWTRSSLRYMPGDILPIQLTGEQARAIARGVAGVDVVGHMMVSEPVLFADLPLALSQPITHGGTRAQITSVDRSADGVSLNASITTVSGRNAASTFMFGMGERSSVALINQHAGEGIELEHRSGGMSNGWALLPSTDSRTESGLYEIPRGAFGPDMTPWSRPAEWYAGARLAIYTWKSQGSYPVRLSTVPGAPAISPGARR